jgi:hypothetical protein
LTVFDYALVDALYLFLVTAIPRELGQSSAEDLLQMQSISFRCEIMFQDAPAKTHESSG